MVSEEPSIDGVACYMVGLRTPYVVLAISPKLLGLAPWRFLWLGCRGVEETPTLDTTIVYSMNRVSGNATEVSMGQFELETKNSPRV